MYSMHVTLIWVSDLFDQFDSIIIYKVHMKGVRPFHLIRAPLHLKNKLSSRH